MTTARLYSPHGGFIKEWTIKGWNELFDAPKASGVIIQQPAGKSVEFVVLGDFLLVIEQQEPSE